jgi:hypothetical protein
MRFTIIETGEEVQAKHRPVVLITSNNEKELPDAFLRRCIFYSRFGVGYPRLGLQSVPRGAFRARRRASVGRCSEWPVRLSPPESAIQREAVGRGVFTDFSLPAPPQPQRRVTRESHPNRLAAYRLPEAGTLVKFEVIVWNPALPIPSGSLVEVQLVKNPGDGTDCWETTLPAPAIVNQPSKFKDGLP